MIRQAMGRGASIRRWRFVLLAALSVAAFAVIPPKVRAQEIVEEPLRIPMKEAGKKGLEAVMVRPNDGAPHPLALLNHGAPRDSGERPGMTPWGLVPQAREFARRGWTTVVVMRRGYGDSGGGSNEDSGPCGNPDYYDSGRESAKDLRAAIAYLSTRTDVDATRIISVGISAGGFATVALTAEPPPGLVAAISFAGGRGSRKPDEVCSPQVLINAFRDFGKKSRIPMLWVYADNDHFFGPQIAAQFHQAFTAAGGQVTFLHAAPFRKDGHGLFSLAGTALWTPMVDQFLARNQLTLRDTLLPLPAPPNVEPPQPLSAGIGAEFRSFLTLPGHRAFAVSESGTHYGFAYGRRTEKEAAKMAEEHCKDATEHAEHCTVIFLDDAKPAN